MPSNLKKVLACSVDKLKENKCFGLEINTDSQITRFFLVYHNNHIHSYLNQCPHTGINLDWVPHQFLDRNNELIQCATHGALFNIEDGYCVRGPCVGDKLQTVQNVVIENNIYLIL